VGQVSKPMQIALVAILLFAAAWFVVLRPKDATDTASEPTPAPAVSTTGPKAPGQAGLERAIGKAKGAVATSQASAAATEAATGGTTTTTTAAKATTPAPAATAVTRNGAAPATDTAAAGDPSAPLLAHIAKGDIVAVLFAQTGGADDADARRALRQLAHADRHVVTRVVPIREVGRYEAITTGVQILTAPTIVLVGKGHQAVTVAGYTEQATLRQLVGDLRRAAK